jgi:hypothetical protein
MPSHEFNEKLLQRMRFWNHPRGSPTTRAERRIPTTSSDTYLSQTVKASDFCKSRITLFLLDLDGAT